MLSKKPKYTPPFLRNYHTTTIRAALIDPPTEDYAELLTDKTENMKQPP